MAGEAATDGFCLAVTVWFLFFADRMVRTGSLVWWLPAAVFGTLSALSKAPFYLTAGLCSVAMLALNNPRRVKPWILLTGVGVVSTGAFVLWSRYADSLAAQAVLPFTELRLSESAWLRYWYFGDLAYRLNPAPWVKGAWRFLHATVGALPMAVILLLGLRSRNPLPKLWLAAFLVATLIFANVVLAHWHYYLIVCPAVAMLCGHTVAGFERWWMEHMPSDRLRLAITMAVLGLSAVQGLYVMRITAEHDPFTVRMSELIRAHTDPSEKVLVHSYHVMWGGEVLFRAERKGLVVSCLKGSELAPSKKGLLDILGNPADLGELKALGYTKLVLISQSPIQYSAVVSSFYGGPDLRRGTYPSLEFTPAENWPTEFRSEDILIKNIPD